LALLRESVRTLQEDLAELGSEGPSSSALSASPNRKIFVVHGHDEAAREAVARFIEQLGFEPIILHERPNKGRTIITKFREEAADIGFAVVVMTPDDLGKASDDSSEPKLRPRQNVVFELGFFIGALGPDRVAAMVKGEIERPSDFDGVIYISIDTGDWRVKLGQELQAAGYEIDWNQVMRV
jgi:predicted nucleotide-binding protein